jgi:hypothetical protein
MNTQNQIKRQLSESTTLEQVRTLAALASHRTALAEQLCARFELHDGRGRAQRSTCLKALRDLERAGMIVLPAPRTRGHYCGPRGLDAPVPVPEPRLPAQVHEVGGVELVEVCGDEQRRVWTELMRREHPLGAPTLAGHQVRYLVRSAHGWIGALGFAAAALKLAPREHWIGWTDAQRRAHLHRVVGLSRFLIRPMIQCHNLASHVLGQALRAVVQDFECRYGYRPWLVESFIDPAQHSGVSYCAANWTCIGRTRGRGRQDRDRTATVTPKDIYVYVLEPAFRNLLGVAAPPPSAEPLAVHEGLDSAQWAEHEFGGAPLGDQRLGRRLVSSAALQATAPMHAFCNVASADWAAVKGYYRLIDQSEDSAVTPANILAPHRARTVRRMQAQDTVLCIQDGTDLNFATHAQCTGLGVIGTNQTGAQSRGLHLHSTYAVSTEGLPLGVLRAHFEAPQPGAAAEAAKPLEQRKSFRWILGLRDCVELSAQCPDTRIVSVMDREADIFELFDEQRTNPSVELLVRAKNNRCVHGAGDTGHDKLFERMRNAPERGRMQVVVTRQSARPKASKQAAKAKREPRLADVSVHFERIELAPTDAALKQREPLALWCVHVREDRAPPGVKALEWFLLTTIAIDTGEQAEQMLRWYQLRWRIEDWHRVLKTGCRVEKLAHDSAERLTRAVAMRLVIAWRVMLMTLLGREVPQLPAELLFSDIELEVLSAYAPTLARPTASPTTLAEAVRLTAIVGGYLARNNDGPPGHELVWSGYARLSSMCLGFALRKNMTSTEP